MRISSTPMTVLACIVCFSGALGASQREDIRALVREQGDITRVLISCGPPKGLKEIVEFTQLTIEGIVSHAETGLAEQGYVYTDYVIDVKRILRMARTVTDRPTSPRPSPFVEADGVAAPAATSARVRLRMINTGTIQLEGGKLTDKSGYPELRLGQHIIASALLRPEVGAWEPFGLFEVQEGRVTGLEGWTKKFTFDSVEAFTSALANPSPTTVW